MFKIDIYRVYITIRKLIKLSKRNNNFAIDTYNNLTYNKISQSSPYTDPMQQ